MLNPDASSDVMILILNLTFQLARTFLCHGLPPPPLSCIVLKKKVFVAGDYIDKRILHLFFGFLQNFRIVFLRF